MIELKSISKSFDGKSVLSNFSIHIEENEFVSIVGKSGSGKTTLLNIISLLDYPDEGKVVILGYE
ncbi:ATP-binding cassette domain-containing protein, partial [Bacillus inaquosorum]